MTLITVNAVMAAFVQRPDLIRQLADPQRKGFERPQRGLPRMRVAKFAITIERWRYRGDIDLKLGHPMEFGANHSQA